VKTLLDALYGLLRPAARHCTVCLREIRGDAPAESAIPVRLPAARAELSRLCSACLTRIPWIRSPLCPVCGRPGRCGDCLRRTKTYFTGVRCAVQYEGEMKQWLADYKYKGAERYATVMAAMLSGALEQLQSASAAARPFNLVTSVPLAPGRLEERGFNQAERMAAALAFWHGIPYRPMLVRTRDTEKQSRKGRRGRIEDMRGLFAPAVSFAVPQRATRPLRILLADDIYTTGSTMNDCARAILEAVPSAEVYGIAWSRT